jgi:threonine dehydratase
MADPAVSLDDIRAARERIASAISRTPLASAENLSRLCGNQIHVKLENLNITGSFKERGALNKLLQLTAAERGAGVIAASAGNHAQGVSYHAQRLGIAATIVMPARTPLIKVSAVKSHGAEVVLHGANYDDAYLEARKIQQEKKLTFVHPFDDPAVIAGQGTIGLEILEQLPDVDTVVVPIGGGGLIAGVAAAIKSLAPAVKIYGVQAKRIASMDASLGKGSLQTLPASRTLAEGIAVRTPGAVTFPMVQRYVDGVVTVDEEEIASSILLLIEKEKTVAEGAGAVPLAAVVNDRLPMAGKKVVLLLSGGNIDVNVLSRIIERGLVKDGRMVRLSVRIQDVPGSLAQITALLGETGANILEIHHNRAFSKADIAETEVEVTLETKGSAHIEQIVGKLKKKGFTVEPG